MPNANAGRLHKVNDSLNKSKTIVGVDYRIIVGGMIVSLVVFLLGATTTFTHLKMAAIALFGALMVIGKFVTKKDPKMVDIVWQSFKQSAFYDAGKRK